MVTLKSSNGNDQPLSVTVGFSISNFILGVVDFWDGEIVELVVHS